MIKPGENNPERRPEKRVYEIKIQTKGADFRELYPEELEQLDMAAANLFAGIIKTEHVEMVRDVRKKALKYSVILDEADPQALEKIRKVLRSFRSEKIVIIDRGRPTPEDYARHENATITIHTNLCTSAEEII